MEESIRIRKESEPTELIMLVSPFWFLGSFWRVMCVCHIYLWECYCFGEGNIFHFPILLSKGRKVQEEIFKRKQGWSATAIEAEINRWAAINIKSCQCWCQCTCSARFVHFASLMIVVLSFYLFFWHLDCLSSLIQFYFIPYTDVFPFWLI